MAASMVGRIHTHLRNAVARVGLAQARPNKLKYER